ALVDCLACLLPVSRDRRRLQLPDQLSAGREDVETRRAARAFANLRPDGRNPARLDVQQFEEADVTGLAVVVGRLSVILCSAYSLATDAGCPTLLESPC